MLIADALRHAAVTLRAAGVENPAREARLLASHVLGVAANTLLPSSTAALDKAAFEAVLQRRAAREPMAYIIGRRGFWCFDLEVSPATLIPRPDSETLIQAAKAHFPDPTRVRRVLDLGTGTGCLLLAALSEFTQAWGLGTDISPATLAVAKRNAARLRLEARSQFLAADWAGSLQIPALAGRFDLILCNPPYIASTDMCHLMPEVAAYEPQGALDGGADGMREYARLIPSMPAMLAPGGLACIELGAGQLAGVVALAEQAGFDRHGMKQDLGGIARALLLPAPVG